MICSPNSYSVLYGTSTWMSAAPVSLSTSPVIVRKPCAAKRARIIFWSMPYLEIRSTSSRTAISSYSCPRILILPISPISRSRSAVISAYSCNSRGDRSVLSMAKRRLLVLPKSSITAIANRPVGICICLSRLMPPRIFDHASLLFITLGERAAKI